MTASLGKVAVVGQGYVGLPLAMRAAEVGYEVIGLDVDESRVKRLAAGSSFVEDVSSEQLSQALAVGQYRPTSEVQDLAGFSVAIITVPTPLREGNPDLSFVEEAVRGLAPFACPGTTIILESTTYPGTTEEFVGPILEEESGMIAGKDFFLGYSPERIDPGNDTWRLINTPKVVSGINEASLVAVQTFYDSLVDKTIPVGSSRVAELTKLMENTFRHVNIALVNELAMFAADLDIDVWEALDAASTKPFGFMPFRPGPGVGGHCLPIDPSYLSWRVKRRLGQSFRFVELANDVNDHMPDYVVRRILLHMNRRQRSVAASRILLLGLAYKKNTGDARESPAAIVAERLVALGANVVAADGLVVEGHINQAVERVDVTAAELSAADLVVLLTDHDCFPYDCVVRHARAILDTRHRMEGSNVEYL